MTTTTSLLTHTITRHVATVTVHHPPVNALTPALLDELDTTFEFLGANAAVKVIVLTGAGQVFIAGADIRMLAAISSAQEGTDMARRGQAIFNKIEALEKPVIVAINGACLGGGLELAMCCPLRLAAEGSRLGQPEITLGIIPGFGGTQRLARLIGRAKATELILTGDLLSAQEAKTLGLVSQVIPPKDLLRQAQRLAQKIASKGQVAIRAALRAMHHGTALELREGLALEAELFGKLCASDDKKEGVTAFLTKRQPQFTDR